MSIGWMARGSSFVVAALLVVACGGSSSVSGDEADLGAKSVTAGGGGGKVPGGGASAGQAAPASAAGESCTATFHWLQKDAYRSTAGRTTAFWPPHTTTTLDVRCTDASGNETYDETAVRENHGTKPGDVDASGRPFLVEMKSSEAHGTREQMRALLDAYKTCECEGSTQFLSMDVVKEDPTMRAILTAFGTYASANLTCASGVTTEGIESMLANADYDGTVKALASCEWRAGASFADGLAAAAGSVVPDLSKFHVCNNDAKLEAALFDRFAKDGSAPLCDPNGALCKGPAFFYSP